ncbi:MAG: hypothetical protein ABII79_07965 [bacterium]
MAMSTRADFGYQVAVHGGYTSDLFKDSSRVEDSYTTPAVSLKYYPAPSIEVDFTSRYTYYSKIFDLSNAVFSGRITHTATALDSRLSVYVTIGHDKQRYRQLFESYDNNITNFKATVGFETDPRVHLRAGSRIKATTYIRADSVDVDNERRIFFGGVNLTLPAENAIDFEIGGGLTNFAFIHQSTLLNGLRPNREDFDDGRFHMFYFSPRYSRPLPLRTGLNLVYTYRRFTRIDSVGVLSYATGFLSPWASVWDGKSVTLELKSYAVPHMIVSAGIGYFDKMYLKEIEQTRPPPMSFLPDEWWEVSEVERRRDFSTRRYISLQRPFSVGRDGLLDAILSVEHVHNESTTATYDYSDVTVYGGVSYRR